MKTIDNTFGIKRASRKIKSGLALALLFGTLVFGGCSNGDEDDSPAQSNPVQTTEQTGTSDAPYSGTSDALTDGSSDVPYQNQAPTIIVTPDFGDGLSGSVDWKVHAEDTDGYVGTIDMNFEGLSGTAVNVSKVNPFEFTIAGRGIRQGTNDFYATSTDNLGLKSGTADYSFYVPSESEARAEIEKILDAWGGTYFKDTTLTFPSTGASSCPPVGTQLSVPVDYKIYNNGVWATINYGSHSDILSDEINNYNLHKICGDVTDDLEVIRTSTDYLKNKVNSFVNNGFKK